MKTVKLEETLPYSASQIWAVIGDVTRSDWMPSVENITEADGVRTMVMTGIGEVQEKILLHDSAAYFLQYSVIKTPATIEHHHSTIKLSSMGEQCHVSWTTEIAPDQLAPAMEQEMKASLEGLKQLLAGGSK